MPTPIIEGKADLTDFDGRLLATVRIRPLGQYGKHNVSVLAEADAEEMAIWGEERLQLLENCSYEYEISDTLYALQSVAGLVTKSSFNRSRGTIETGSNIGLLVIHGEDEDSVVVGRIAVEVRSSKLDYRQHYRQMLEDITDKCADLLMQIRSPAYGLFHPDPLEASTIVAQRFSFLKHLLTTKEFRYATTQILADPHIKLVTESNRQETGVGFKPTGAVLRQFRSSPSQRQISPDHQLSSKLPSVPSHLLIHSHSETSDTNENQFVKYILESFILVFSEMQKVMEKKNLPSPADNRLLNDIKSLKESITDIISQNFFRRISVPSSLNLGSPVLQNKSGYREMLITWLRFNAAARLVWIGGHDIFGGGKRDVAILYEYWVFFKLLDLVQSVFNLSPADVADLIEHTSDGFGLKLKSGKSLLIKGHTVINGRNLWVQFSYNKIYNRSSEGSEEDNYPSAGSWTQIMRPDYSLSLWPYEFSELESEREELITHVHFDAKYKINSPAELLQDSNDNEIDDEGFNSKGRSAKRTDFLTLHSYRDAIRRTDGAYLIYPGDQSVKWQSYHELLPGIGAFALRPENSHYGLSDISRFLNEAATHLSNRATLREKVKLSKAKSYAQKAGTVNTNMPELIFNSRVTHPDECLIIKFSVFTEQQLFWIIKNRTLAIPLKDNSVLDSRMLQLNLAVIAYSDTSMHLFSVNPHKCELINGVTLKKIEYPDPAEDQQYFCLELESQDRYLTLLELVHSMPTPGFFQISRLTDFQ